MQSDGPGFGSQLLPYLLYDLGQGRLTSEKISTSSPDLRTHVATHEAGQSLAAPCLAILRCSVPFSSTPSPPVRPPVLSTTSGCVKLPCLPGPDAFSGLDSQKSSQLACTPSPRLPHTC